MKSKYLHLEYVIYLAAFLIALAVRFANLGTVPLTDQEAALALQASAIAHGDAVLVSPQPLYLSLTTALMFLFGPGNWAARFWPALAGSLIVLLPVLYRGKIGKLPAVFLAVFLALDPALVAVSRMAGSLTLALFFILFSVGLWLNGGLWFNRRYLLAGVFAGLALLSGPAIWPGMVALLAAAAAGGVSRGSGQSWHAAVVERAPDDLSPARWRQAVLAALVSAFLAGTLFFTIPNGLSAMAASLPAYLNGWGQPSAVPLELMLTVLALYEFVPLVFGIWGGVRGLLRRNDVDRFLLVWWVVALALTLLYPSRTVVDLTWPVLPLWALAARQVARLFQLPPPDRAPIIGQALLSTVIIAFVSLSSIAVINNPNLDQQEYWTRLAGALFMLAASSALVAWGWSRLVALRGLAIGAAVVLLVYMISTAWHAAGFSGAPGREVWAGAPAFSSSDLLVKTINDLNQWGPQQDSGLDIVVVKKASPALQWLLRGYPVKFVDSLPSEAGPALVITASEPELALSATYRGQSFLAADGVSWGLLNTADWLRWLVFRSIPGDKLIQDRIILWARLDLFPGGQSAANQAPAIQQPAQDGGAIQPEAK